MKSQSLFSGKNQKKYHQYVVKGKKNLADDILKLFLPESRLWYSMQIVS